MATTPTTLSVGVDPFPFVTAPAQALAAVFKMGDAIFEALNSPQMLALRQTQDIQAILNQWDADLKAAQKTGDLTTIDKESSG